MKSHSVDRIAASSGIDVELDWGSDGVQVVYFRITHKRVSRTIEERGGDVLIDLDSQNRRVGVELLKPARVRLGQIFELVDARFPSEDLRNLPSDRVRKMERALATI
jgi:hypothetical protein